MTKKYKAKTVGAIFDGQPPGSIIEVSESVARKYESVGYLTDIEEVKTKKASKKKAEETSEQK